MKVICIDTDGAHYKLELLKLYGIYEVLEEKDNHYVLDGIDVAFSKSRFHVPNHQPGNKVVYIGSLQEYRDKVFTVKKVKDTEVEVQEVTVTFRPYVLLLVNLYKGKAKGTCPDCKGTGVYIGLIVKEPCRTCQSTELNNG